MSKTAEDRPLYDMRAILTDIGMIKPEGDEPYPLDGDPSCEQCGATFKPRSSGGKKQRFCSPDCRQAYHSETGSQRKQRGQRETLGTALIPLPQPPVPENETEDVNSGFEWTADDSVVIRGQRAVAVYFNQAGDVVIREEEPDGDDPFIVIGRQNLGHFIAALKAHQDTIEEGGPR